jgi:hypothetical protein
MIEKRNTSTTSNKRAALGGVYGFAGLPAPMVIARFFGQPYASLNNMREQASPEAIPGGPVH